MESAEFMGWALGGLEREIAETRSRLATLVDQASKLRTRMGRPAGKTTAVTSTASEGTIASAVRRGISPEGRRRISEMMKKRWAERKRRGKRTLAG